MDHHTFGEIFESDAPRRARLPRLYDRAHSMPLKKFCKALRLGTKGSSNKITALPADLLELYRGITNDDDHRAQ